MAKSLLQDESQMAELTTDYGNRFETITPDIEADPEEEEAMALAMHKFMSDMYGEGTMPKVANVLHQDKRPLYEVIPDMLEPMLLASKQEVEELTEEPAPASIFFAEGGMLQTGVTLLFEMAQVLAIPGSDDPDQFSAALMATYKKAGEHILETDDKSAIAEAIELGGGLVAEAETGSADLDAAQAIMEKRLKKSGVAGAVDAAFADAAASAQQQPQAGPAPEAAPPEMQGQGGGLLGGM